MSIPRGLSGGHKEIWGLCSRNWALSLPTRVRTRSWRKGKKLIPGAIPFFPPCQTFQALDSVEVAAPVGFFWGLGI